MTNIGRQRDLRSLDLAHRVFAAVKQRHEFRTLRLAQIDPVSYVHRWSPAVEDHDESGRWFATRLHTKAGPVSGVHSRLYAGERTPAAEADMIRFFRVTPPTVHQMVLGLEKADPVKTTVTRYMAVRWSPRCLSPLG
jgi:hypothetical protein